MSLTASSVSSAPRPAAPLSVAVGPHSVAPPSGHGGIAITTRLLADRSRALLLWCAGVAATVALMVAIWPTFRDRPEYSELVESYPEALLALFGGREGLDMTTAAGYLNIELMGMMLPLLFAVFGIWLGASALAGEEEAGTLDLLLATRLTRPRVLAEKALAVTLATVTLGVVTFVTFAVSSAAVSTGISPANLAAATACVTTLGLFSAAVALAVGASWGRKGLAIAVASTVVVVSYLVNALSELVEFLKPLRPLSVFAQTSGTDPLRTGMAWLPLTVVVAVAAAVVALGALAFRRRDVHG